MINSVHFVCDLYPL